MVMADRIIILDRGEIAQTGTPEEVYNRPASAFVAAFMGADNVIRLDIDRTDEAVSVPSTEHHAAVLLPIARSEKGGGVHIVDSGNGAMRAHFRSEAARLVNLEDKPSASLILRGHITQASYPGGFYRYTVDVGDNQFLVDHPERLAVGERVGINLPATALHLYPDKPERKWSEPSTKDRQSTDPLSVRRKVA